MKNNLAEKIGVSEAMKRCQRQLERRVRSDRSSQPRLRLIAGGKRLKSRVAPHEAMASSAMGLPLAAGMAGVWSEPRRQRSWGKPLTIATAAAIVLILLGMAL